MQLSLSNIRDALAPLPDGLKDPLIAEFESALSEYRTGDWEKVGLKAGKFCEIAYCACAGHATGAFPTFATKPANFPKSCLDLEQYNKTKGRPLCIQVPRVLLGLYELRNSRAIGHVGGGEIDPNHMDAEFFLRGMKWVMAEFVRVFSRLPPNQSHALIEAVTARTFHIVWQNGEVRRILEPARTAAQRVLILLYAENQPTKITQLQKWSEYKNTTEFKQKILRKLHSDALIHFDEKKGIAEILPPGRLHVEDSGLLVTSRSGSQQRG